MCKQGSNHTILGHPEPTFAAEGSTPLKSKRLFPPPPFAEVALQQRAELAERRAAEAASDADALRQENEALQAALQQQLEAAASAQAAEEAGAEEERQRLAAAVEQLQHELRQREALAAQQEAAHVDRMAELQALLDQQAAQLQEASDAADPEQVQQVQQELATWRQRAKQMKQRAMDLQAQLHASAAAAATFAAPPLTSSPEGQQERERQFVELTARCAELEAENARLQQQSLEQGREGASPSEPAADGREAAQQQLGELRKQLAAAVERAALAEAEAERLRQGAAAGAADVEALREEVDVMREAMQAAADRVSAFAWSGRSLGSFGRLSLWVCRVARAPGDRPTRPTCRQCGQGCAPWDLAVPRGFAGWPRLFIGKAPPLPSPPDPGSCCCPGGCRGQGRQQRGRVRAAAPAAGERHGGDSGAGGWVHGGGVMGVGGDRVCWLAGLGVSVE